MSITYANLIDGDSARYTKRGWENVSRTALVDQIPIGLDGDAKILFAFDALGIDIGFEHPSFVSNFITSIQPTSISTDSVRFTVNYEQMQGFADEISGGGSLTQIETNEDKKGNTIELVYDYPDDYDIDTKYAGQTDVVSKLIKTDRNVAPFAIKRRVIFDNLTDPLDLATKYVGKVNNDDWSIVTDGATRKWKCIGIDFDYVIPVIIGGGKKFAYDVLYQFQFKDDKWTEVLVYTDPNTGNPPTDAETEEWEVLKEEAFNDLIDEIIT